MQKWLETKLKFLPQDKMSSRYHDHGTHSSCQSGGELVFIWEMERATKLGIQGDPWVEIGAIIKEIAYARNDEGLVDIVGSRYIYI
jgi:hypothetical protein